MGKLSVSRDSSSGRYFRMYLKKVVRELLKVSGTSSTFFNFSNFL